MQNIHATSVFLNNKGILILGGSGSGKSDLALRLIEQASAILIADDRTDLRVENKDVYASCPENLKGLLEVRGVGIVKKPTITQAKIKLVVELVKNIKDIERLPEKQYWEYDKIKIRKIKLYPFEPSAIYKVRLACDEKA